MLLAFISKYNRSLERKRSYDFDDLDLINGINNCLCHFAITRKRFPLRVISLPAKHGNKAYLALLLILSGDIELNPGPMSSTCKTKTRKNNKEKKGKEVNSEVEITDINSVISKFKIDVNLTIPKEHPSNFLERYKDTKHFSYSTTNSEIAGTILAYHNLMYDKLGLDDDYHVSWLNLINTDSS